MRRRDGRDWLAARPVAHRGLHDAAAGVLENTLPAIEAAIAAGYAIEIDVQAAAGLEPVVFHDATLERLSGERGPVSARTADELAAVRLQGRDARIPRLGDVLDLVAGRVPLFVEVKTDDTGMPAFCERVVRAVSGYAGPLALMSFEPKAVAAVRRQAPETPRGIVAAAFRDPDAARGPLRRFALRHMLHFPLTRPHFVAYGIDDLPAPAPRILQRTFGLPLLAWTVRTGTQRRRAARWADQMIFEGFRP